MTPSLPVLLHGLCTGAAALCALVGIAVLVSDWALGEPLALMKPSTAACFALAGASLWVLSERPATRRVRVLADGAAGIVGLLAVITLAAQLAGRDPAGRMASPTALCFLLLALALLSLDRAPVFPTGQRLAVVSCFLSLLVVVAWAYGAGTPPRGPAAMAPLTGILLVILSVAVTAARPGRGATGIFVQDTAGGMVARWVFPGTTLGALVVGAIALAGERAGLYGREFAIAFTTVASLSLFSALVWFISVRLHRTDARRLAAEAELRGINAELEARVQARTLALVASEARYRQLIEESPDGIMIHQAGVIRLMNRAGLQMFGHAEPAQAVGRPLLDYIAPEHREIVAARVAARLAQGDSTAQAVEVETLRTDGTRFWIGAVATIIDWEGSPASLVSFVDISERRRREVVEREAESLRAVAKLANAAAHEINNPLTVVGGNMHLLAARIADRPELQRYVDRVLRAVRTIADMINHMTRITRLSALSHLDTAGVPILDLRSSSQAPEPVPGPAPGPEPDRAPGEPPRPL
jgi:PAS domain S-box-containing protein